jgi:hypothetical protein
MAYGVYTPGSNSEQGAPASVEIVTHNERDAVNFNFLVLSRALDRYFRDEIGASEVDGLIIDVADANELTEGDTVDPSLEVIQDLVEEEELVLIDEQNLALWGKDEDGEESSPVLVPHNMDTAAFVGGGVTDDEYTMAMVAQGRFTRYGHTLEPFAEPHVRSGTDFYEHYALGHENEDGIFEPVLTVLGRTHVVRRMVEEQVDGPLPVYVTVQE